MADPSALSERRRQSYLALCSPEELARHARIRHAETRDHHLLTRALVRTSLSRYSERAPEAWRFVENDHGCPFIEPSQNAQGLQFNVSHTTGLILCALTQRRAIGVDVRALAPPVPDADALFHFKSHPLSDRAVVVPRRGAPRSAP